MRMSHDLTNIGMSKNMPRNQNIPAIHYKVTRERMLQNMRFLPFN